MVLYTIQTDDPIPGAHKFTRAKTGRRSDFRYFTQISKRKNLVKSYGRVKAERHLWTKNFVRVDTRRKEWRVFDLIEAGYPYYEIEPEDWSLTEWVSKLMEVLGPGKVVWFGSVMFFPSGADKAVAMLLKPPTKDIHNTGLTGPFVSGI